MGYTPRAWDPHSLQTITAHTKWSVVYRPLQRLRSDCLIPRI